MSDIQLLVTDFDGTIFRYGNEKALYASFAQSLDQLRQHGGLWVVCSGRRLSSLRKATRSMLRSGVSPDMIIARHSFIYARRGGIWHWKPLLTLRTLIDQRQLQKDIHRSIEDIVSYVKSLTERARATYIKRSHVRLFFGAQEDLETLKELVSREIERTPEIRAQWHPYELEIRAISPVKGVAVKHVRISLDIEPNRVLAIGDGRSDIAMMSPSHGLRTGCPSNSRREVIHHVLTMKGHIASKDSLAGVIEILDAYSSGNVKSVPPPNWDDKDPFSPSSDDSANGPERGGIRTIEVILISSALVACVLTLAHFGVIPFGRYLLKPFTLVLDKAMNLLF